MSETWRIEKLIPGGEGMARLADGRIAFAPGTAVGDVIEPTETEARKRWVRAHSFRLVEAGPTRVPPPCPIADRCGGCDWMHLSVDAQRAHKREILAEALRRTGGLAELPAIDLVTAGEALGYRRRLRLHVDDGGRLGLYAPRSHDVVEVERCAVADDTINEALARVRAAAATHADAMRGLEGVEIRSAPEPPRSAISLFPRGKLDEAVEARITPLIEALAGTDTVSVAGAKDARAAQRLPLVEDVALHAPPGVFTQVHWRVNQHVIGDLLAEADRRGVQHVLDLFAGAGNFSLPLAKAGHHVTAVERDARSVRAARAAAREAKLDTVRFRLADANREASALAKTDVRFDLVILDPPRQGAGAAALAATRLASRAIAYVSCDPVTLARDLKRITETAFRLDALRVYDMFPQTHHVEVVAWLSRK